MIVSIGDTYNYLPQNCTTINGHYYWWSLLLIISFDDHYLLLMIATIGDHYRGSDLPLMFTRRCISLSSLKASPPKKSNKKCSSTKEALRAKLKSIFFSMWPQGDFEKNFDYNPSASFIADDFSWYERKKVKAIIWYLDCDAPFQHEVSELRANVCSKLRCNQ